MDARIGSRRLTYIFKDIDKLKKVSVIQGDSGTGKTKFYEICEAIGDNTVGYINESGLPIQVVAGRNAEACNKSIIDMENTLIVIDENSKFLKQDAGKIGEIIYSTSNKYLIISRDKKFNNLPIAIDSILHITHLEGKRVNIISRLYSVQNISSPTEIDILLTEDEKSSCYFFKDYFNKIDVESAGGKNNVRNYLGELFRCEKPEDRQLIESKNILVVVDACAFGIEYGRVERFISKHTNVYLLAWECFEAYILNSPNFKHSIDSSRIQRESEYCDLLQNLIGYKKSNISDCISQEFNCKQCDKYNNCDYRVLTSRRDNYIHDEAKYITQKFSNKVESFGIE